jgi:hypothetical protein
MIFGWRLANVHPQSMMPNGFEVVEARPLMRSNELGGRTMLARAGLKAY